jgi:hypothetical protein
MGEHKMVSKHLVWFSIDNDIYATVARFVNELQAPGHPSQSTESDIKKSE